MVVTIAQAQTDTIKVIGLDYQPVTRFDHPLYFVNGKNFSSDSLQYIDPNQIESIDVIKGMDAQERYGNQGKDGVLLIKLKNLARTKED